MGGYHGNALQRWKIQHFTMGRMEGKDLSTGSYAVATILLNGEI